MASSSAARLGALALTLGLACQADPTDPAPASTADPTATPVVGAATAEPVPAREEARRLRAAFAAALEPVAELSFEALHRDHAPAYLPAHGLDVRRAEHYAAFVKAFELTAAEQARLDALGFVVVPSREQGGAGPVDLYYRVFAADLPVLITADSVLHAWHRSYDDILEWTEERVLIDALSGVLRGLYDALDPKDPAQRDARVHLAVARVLLHGDDDAARSIASEHASELAPILAAIAAHEDVTLELMGAPVSQDFSQMIPRGHYTHSKTLEHYFQAMMWLGRVDLRLYDPTEDAAPNPREEAAARALAAALVRSGQQGAFEEIERFYRLHVGRPNALAPADLLALCTKTGAPTCEGDGSGMREQYQAQGSAAYSSQRPAPGKPLSAALPVSMRLFPQRFAYDAWITTQTTAPRLPFAEGEAPRTMASPYDVAFALGSDRALDALLEEGPPAQALAGRMEATRKTIHGLAPTELDETIYDHWLEALMAVAETDLDERLPKVMRTAVWHDHRLETVLASWAELRHDTVLVVEQSEAGFGCQYPKGYVEPLPQLYRELDEAAAHLVSLYETEGGALAQPGMVDSVPAWGRHFRESMQRLARLSEQELRGEPMSAEDLAFINHTVDRHMIGYGGSRSYDGWYPALYWQPLWSLRTTSERALPHREGGESEPIVTDVHTDALHGKVLEVGTGHPELIIVVVDQGDDVAVYGGSTSSFYAFERPQAERMTDDAWAAAVQSHALPSRPAFAQRYRAE